MFTPTSTVITVWAPGALSYIWDSITGFFYTAGGSQFTIVFIVLFAIVCLAIGSIPYIFKRR